MQSIARIERAYKIGATSITGIFRSAAMTAAILEANLQSAQERLWEATRRNWILLHTRPTKHTCWRLVKQLNWCHHHISPMEQTAKHFSSISQLVGKVTKIPPFSKPPWTQPPPIIILPKETSIAEFEATAGSDTVYTGASLHHGRIGLAVSTLSVACVRTLDRGPKMSAMAAELEAIEMALSILASHTMSRTQVDIVTNNQEAINRLRKPHRSWTINSIYKALNNLQLRGVSIRLIWVSGHTRIPGIGKAHTKAQEAAGISQTPENSTIEARAIKPIAQEEERRRLLTSGRARQLLSLDQALPGKHTRKLYNNLTRTDASILAQLRTGYSRLNSYLYKINKAESNLCQCGEEETVEHFLTQCKRWQQQREAIWGNNQPGIHTLCGAWNGLDQKWKPNMAAIKKTVEYAKLTGRLNPEYRED